MRLSRVVRTLVPSFSLFAAAAATPAAAWALDPSCTAPFTHPQWVEAMNNIDDEFEKFDLDGARTALTDVQRQLVCLDTVAKPGHLARFAREKSLLYFFDQDEESAIKWGLTARYAAEDFPWAVPEDHPFRDMLTSAENPPVGGPGGSLLADKKTFAFLNSAPLLEAKAYAEVPNFVQFTDKKGAVTRAFWQDGAAFPADIIGPAGPAAPAPVWWVRDADYASAGGKQLYGKDGGVADGSDTPPDGTDGTKPPDTVIKPPDTVIKPPDTVTKPPDGTDGTKPPDTVTEPPDGTDGTKPPDGTDVPDGGFKDPLDGTKPPDSLVDNGTKPPKIDKPDRNGIGVANLATGGGLAVLAGGLYAVAALSAGQLDNASTEAELAAIRTRANLMVIGAGVAGAAAIGVGVTAFVGDHGGGIGIHGRF